MRAMKLEVSRLSDFFDYEPRSLSDLSFKIGGFSKHPAKKDSHFGRNAVRLAHFQKVSGSE
jgi:hypothetical protein